MTLPAQSSTTIVQPDTGRLEAMIVAAALLVVLAAATAFAFLRDEAGGPEPLTDWQLSAFEDLGQVDRFMHAALLSATEEITFVQQEYAEWLSIEDLEEQFIPPFVQDAFWKTNGEVEWSLHHPVGTAETAQGATYYFGQNGKADGQGAYLIVQRHSHAGYNAITEPEIWLHPNPAVAEPSELRKESLISGGWRQVISYSGADEARRIR